MTPTKLIGRALILLTLFAVGYVYWHGHGGAVIRRADVERATVPARLNGTHPCVFADITPGGAIQPALGQCATPTEHKGSQERVEVDLRYGAFILRETDLLVNGKVEIPLARAYFSNAPGYPLAFGLNSNQQYDVAPVGSRFPYTYVNLLLEDNDFLFYKRISSGTGYKDAVYLHTETSTRFYKSTFAWNGNGWTLRLADGSEMIFPEAYEAKNLAQGAATQIIDPAGNKLVLQRDSERNLQQVLSPDGHWIRFSDDDQGRIVRAEDSNGDSVRYLYNFDGMLVNAIRSSGADRTYDYDFRLMTSVTDEHGRVLVRNSYKDGILAKQVYANGDVYTYAYDWAPGKAYANSAIVTLPGGSQNSIDVAAFVPDSMRNRE